MWRQTLERAPHHAAAEENLAILERDGVPPAHPALLNWPHVVPIDWVNRLRAADPASVDTCFDELSATDTYLEAIYLAGDALVRFFATQLLKHRLTRESQAEPLAEGRPERRAATILRDLARLPVGTEQERLGMLRALREAECRDQLRRTITAHPDYLFARVNLAGLLIEDGDLEEAKTLLSGLGSRPRLHIQEAFALYGVLAMLNRATGEDASADALIATLERMVRTDEDRRLLATAKARVARASRGGLSRRRTAGPGAA